MVGSVKLERVSLGGSRFSREDSKRDRGSKKFKFKGVRRAQEASRWAAVEQRA